MSERVLILAGVAATYPGIGRPLDQLFQVPGERWLRRRHLTPQV